MKTYFSLIVSMTVLFSACSKQIIISCKKQFSNSVAYYYLPKGMISIRVSKYTKTNRTNFRYSTTLIPDPDNKYYLNYKQISCSDDQISIKLTKEGFIDRVSVSVEDKSDEIVIKLASITTESLKAVSMFPAAVYQPAEHPIDSIYYAATFDPFTELHNINHDLEKFGYQLTFKSLSSRKEQDKQERITPPVPAGHPSQGGIKEENLVNYPGIRYKPLAPFEFTITGLNGNYKSKEIIYLPGDHEILTFYITRANFVKKVTELKFEDGILRQFSINKPSQALALIEIPLNIIKAIVALPTELIQIKINTAAKNKELYETQRAEIHAKDEFIKYLKEQVDKESRQ